ncbi:hypothetical protein AAC387_Pa07g0201 [Persea americana]
MISRSRRSRRRKGNIWILMFIHYESWYDDIICHKGQFYAVRSNGAIGVLHINTRNPYVATLTGKVNFIPGQPRPVIPIRHSKTYLVPDSASEGIFIIKRIYRLKRIRTVNFVHGRNFHSTYDFQVYELGTEETMGTYKKFEQTTVEAIWKFGKLEGRCWASSCFCEIHHRIYVKFNRQPLKLYGSLEIQREDVGQAHASVRLIIEYI